MIFQHTHQWITGTSPHTGLPKSQTRRLAAGYTFIRVPDGRITHIRKNGRLRWHLGGEYSVQPGRGQRGVGRIAVVAIRLEDVRYISQAGAKAEGFADVAGFLDVWRLMHDYTHRHTPIEQLAQRPLERYQAVVLEFEAR